MTPGSGLRGFFCRLKASGLGSGASEWEGGGVVVVVVVVVAKKVTPVRIVVIVIKTSQWVWGLGETLRVWGVGDGAEGLEVIGFRV